MKHLKFFFKQFELITKSFCFVRVYKLNQGPLHFPARVSSVHSISSYGHILVPIALKPCVYLCCGNLKTRKL